MAAIELPPTAYQFKFGKITKALIADSMVEGTLVFEKLHAVPIHFMVEQDDTAPKEDAAPAQPVPPARPGPAKAKPMGYDLPWSKDLTW